MKLLIIYENVGEFLLIYEEIVEENEYKRIVACHHKYTNCADNTGEDDENLDWLYRWLKDKKPIYDNTESSDTELSVPCIEGKYEVVVTGFLP